MLKNRIQYLILFVFILGLCIFTNQYFVFILLLFFTIFPIFSFILLTLSHRRVTVDFEIPHEITKSESALINFTLNNSSFFPVSGAVLYLTCRNNLTGKENDIKMFCAIGNKNLSRTSFMVSDMNAGRISVILNKMKVCDFSGLFSLSKNINNEKSGLIYPEIYQVKIATQHQTEINGDGEHYSQTKKGQDVNDIFALREYIQGDEIRKIHWKLSAKQSKLIVRDFGFSLNYPIFLLLEIFNNKKEDSDKALDACMITFVSVSQSLIEKGICHNIAWYDSASERLIVKEIESLDALEAYLPELLSIQSYDEYTAALRFYEAGDYRNTQLVLYYITTKLIPEEIAKRSLYQTVKTIHVTEETKDITDDSNITIVTPENIKEGMGNIIM
ncbi:MAG: DUF58 domain-containing protein [Clostridiaceae bacterium]